MSALRVLLVDDQPMMRTGLRLILEAEPDIAVVGEAGDGERAIEDARTLQLDVVVMDIRMPRMDGIEATRRILAAGSTARILMLTTFDIDAHVIDALRAGASGFLVKDDAPTALVDAIRIVAAGDAILTPKVTRRLLHRFARLPAADDPKPPALDQLTEREIEVLREVAQGLSNAEVAEALFVSEATVKTHVAHVLDKLGLRNRVQAVIYAYESGLVRPRR
jgi:DNA-binding NarL/FixJ family response regulator